MEPRVHVLIVDDSADTRETLGVLLELEGYAVSLARHGREALEIQGRAPADIVITDVYMPEQDGIETMHALRVRFPHVKVIVMSGTARLEAVEVVARELGVSAVLQKPVAPSELVKLIEEMTGRHEE
jgi:DNA-binding NtrC family response regulator